MSPDDKTIETGRDDASSVPSNPSASVAQLEELSDDGSANGSVHTKNSSPNKVILVIALISIVTLGLIKLTDPAPAKLCRYLAKSVNMAKPAELLKMASAFQSFGSKKGSKYLCRAATKNLPDTFDSIDVLLGAAKILSYDSKNNSDDIQADVDQCIDILVKSDKMDVLELKKKNEDEVMRICRDLHSMFKHPMKQSLKLFTGCYNLSNAYMYKCRNSADAGKLNKESSELLAPDMPLTVGAVKTHITNAERQLRLGKVADEDDLFNNDFEKLKNEPEFAKDVPKLLSTFGHVLKAANYPDRAEKWFLRACEAEQKEFPKDFNTLSQYFVDVGLCFIAETKYKDADLWLNKGLQNLQKGCDPLSKDQLVIMSDLIELNSRRRFLPKLARPLYDKELQIVEKNYGGKSLEMFGLCYALADCNFLEGNYTEAESLIKKGLEIINQTEHKNEFTSAQIILADSYREQKQYAEASKIYEPILEACRAALKTNDQFNTVNLVSALDGMGTNLHLQGNDKEALPLLQEALNIDQQNHIKDLRLIYRLKMHLLECLFALHNDTEAAKYYDDVMRLADSQIYACDLAQTVKSLRSINKKADADKIESRFKKLNES